MAGDLRKGRPKNARAFWNSGRILHCSNMNRVFDISNLPNNYGA